MVVVISHARLQNKYVNVREWVEVVEKKKDGPLPSPAVLWIVSVLTEKKTQTSWKVFFSYNCDGRFSSLEGM